MRAIAKLCLLAIVSICVTARAAEEEAVMEEIVVEAPFDLRLELPNQRHVEIMIDRLTLKEETERAQALQIANRTPLGTLLDLTRYSPIPLGGSDSRVDTFFQQNYLRADLNPPAGSVLFDDRKH